MKIYEYVALMTKTKFTKSVRTVAKIFKLPIYYYSPMNIYSCEPSSWLRHYATNWKVAGSSPG
jgi:hypothetical protein